jgi:signal transduction histidine kinase
VNRCKPIIDRRGRRTSVVWRLCLLLSLVLLLHPPASAASLEAKRVVLLFDERVELPGLSLLEAEFVRTLNSSSSQPVEVYREPMDLSRFGSAQYRMLFRNFLKEKYADKKVDVAVAVMAPSLDFLLDNGGEVFPGAQVVFCGIDRTQLGDRNLPSNVHGILLKRQFAPTLEIALTLHPETEKVVVVAGTSDFDRGLLAVVRRDLAAFERRVPIEYLTELPLQGLLTKVSQFPPNTVVLFTTLFRDGTGTAFVPHDVVGRISAAANAPVYSFVDQYLGRGIVGGSLYSLADQGSKAARLTLQVLAGPPETVPTLNEASSSKMLFDWRQLQRWGIPESRLPSGSQINFRAPSTWERYRWQIAMVGSVVALQAMLIAGLLYERRRRQFAEVEARQRMAELAHVNRYSMAGELTTSIAHELNQPLGSILVNTETATLMLDSPSLDVSELKEVLSDIRRDDQRAGEVIRRLRSLLKRAPFETREIDVNDAVSESIDLVSGLVHVREVIVGSALAPGGLPVRGDRIQLQQVLLNLIVNAADAMAHLEKSKRKIVVRTARNDDSAEIEIADNGPGILAGKLSEVFEPFYSTKPNGMGMGLSIARTIIEAHGGRISAENRAGQGALFRITLPLARSAVGAAAAS